jgi:hypothetical protein
MMSDSEGKKVPQKTGVRKKAVGIMAVAGVAVVIAGVVYASLLYPWNSMVGGAGFTVNPATWYVPADPDNPAASFFLDSKERTAPVDGWNLQVRKAGGGILREIFGNAMVPAELSWDGLDSSGTYIPPGTDCHAFLTVTGSGSGMRLYQTRFKLGMGLRAAGDEFEAMTGPLDFPGSGTDANRYSVLDDNQVKQLESIALALKGFPAPRMTIWASGLTETTPAAVDGILALKRAAFVRRVLQSAGVDVTAVELGVSPAGPGPVPGVRIVIGTETVERLLTKKGKD